MKKILYFLLLVSVPTMVTLWSFKPSRGEIVQITVEKIDSDNNEPWLIKASKASSENFNLFRAMGLGTITLSDRASSLPISRSGTYVNVYKNANIAEKPVETFIDGETIQAAIDSSTAGSNYPTISNSLLVIYEDGTATLMSQSQLTRSTAI